MASISFKHIYKVYPKSKKETEKILREGLSPFAVRDFNLEIEDGEFVVLVGPSGCGKSTTLRMVAGLESISSGELYIDGILSNEIDASKRNIAMVFQNYALYPHMTAYQNMSYGLKLRKISKPVLVNGEPVYDSDKNLVKELQKKIKKCKDDKELEELNRQLETALNTKVIQTKLVHYTKEEIDEKVKTAAELLGITDLLDRKPSDMSGGQRQRVALGRALVRNPKIFLFDEPLSNLDAKLRASMRSEIVKLYHRVKTTFLYVTHDQVEAMTMGTRIIVMKDGVIQQEDTPSNIFDKPINKFVAGFIGTPQMNFFEVDIKKVNRSLQIIFENGFVYKKELAAFRSINESYLDGETHKVLLGLRSEHIFVDKNGLDATVEYSENLGNDTIVLAKLSTGKEFNISFKTRNLLEQNDKLTVNFKPADVHLFNIETETTIYK